MTVMHYHYTPLCGAWDFQHNMKYELIQSYVGD